MDDFKFSKNVQILVQNSAKPGTEPAGKATQSTDVKAVGRSTKTERKALPIKQNNF